MPHKVLENYSQRSGKSIEECEKIWNEAKEQANKRFPKDQWESNEYWAYVNTITLMRLNIKTPKEKPKHDSKRD